MTIPPCRPVAEALSGTGKQHKAYIATYTARSTLPVGDVLSRYHVCTWLFAHFDPRCFIFHEWVQHIFCVRHALTHQFVLTPSNVLHEDFQQSTQPFTISKPFWTALREQLQKPLEFRSFYRASDELVKYQRLRIPARNPPQQCR